MFSCSPKKLICTCLLYCFTSVPTLIGFGSVFFYTLFFFTSNGKQQITRGKQKKSDAKRCKTTSDFDKFWFCIFPLFFSHRMANNKPQMADGESQAPKDARRVPILIGFGFVFLHIVFFHIERRTTNHKQQTAKIKHQTMEGEFQL